LRTILVTYSLALAMTLFGHPAKTLSVAAPVAAVLARVDGYGEI